MSEILRLAESLIPTIRAFRHMTENDRRVADPIVQAIRKSDLCRMLLDTGGPPRYRPVEWLSVLEMLAGAEAAVSWLVWNSALPCFWARFLEPAARARKFGDSTRLFAGSTRPTGKAVTAQGGFRLSGRWSLVSGCELADYLHLISLVYADGAPHMLADGQPDLRVLFIPKGSYAILDTWHAGGLRGTGSHDIVVEDVFVPVEDSFAPAPPTASNSGLAQLPIIPMMIAGLGAQSWGWRARHWPSPSRYCAARFPSIPVRRSTRDRVCSRASRRIGRRSAPQKAISMQAWRRCGTVSSIASRPSTTAQRSTAPACMPPKSAADASQRCMPPPARPHSMKIARWNEACAIYRQWTDTSRPNRSGRKTRGGYF